MELKIRVADPAGNITIFVLTPLERSRYAIVANALMALSDFKAEQVGFMCTPVWGGRARLEMMGGEFCGNAARSFGYMLSLLDPQRPDQAAIEVSGSNEILQVTIDHHKQSCRTQMPLPQKTALLHVPKWGDFTFVVFEGLVHVIVPAAPVHSQMTDDIFDAVKRRETRGAYGIMFLEKHKMTPLVYVEATQSMIWEGSCGSGSMACAVYLSEKKNDGIFRYNFNQPKGRISAEIHKEKGAVIKCTIDGQVFLSEEISVSLEGI